MKLKLTGLVALASLALIAGLAPTPAAAASYTPAKSCSDGGKTGYNRVTYVAVNSQVWAITSVQYNFRPTDTTRRKSNQNFNVHSAGSSVTGNQYSPDSMIRDSTWRTSRSGMYVATQRGSTYVYFYDIFDTTGNDPECGVNSATF